MEPKRVLNPDRQRVLTEATVRAAELLGLSGEALARTIGVSASTVSRMRGGSFQLDPDSKAWELSALLVRLYRGLDAIVAGDESSLQAWMLAENNALHGIPAELVTTAAGLNDTLAYVDAHRAHV